MDDRYETMRRDELDADLRERCRNVEQTLAYIRSVVLSDDDIRCILRKLDVRATERLAEREAMGEQP